MTGKRQAGRQAEMTGKRQAGRQEEMTVKRHARRQARQVEMTGRECGETG
jgi:hypothetical protein